MSSTRQGNSRTIHEQLTVNNVLDIIDHISSQQEDSFASQSTKNESNARENNKNNKLVGRKRKLQCTMGAVEAIREIHFQFTSLLATLFTHENLTSTINKKKQKPTTNNDDDAPERRYLWTLPRVLTLFEQKLPALSKSTPKTCELIQKLITQAQKESQEQEQQQEATTDAATDADAAPKKRLKLKDATSRKRKRRKLKLDSQELLQEQERLLQQSRNKMM